ncbi:MAG: hypothetical protein QXT77_07805 [Candidatus Methanomethylicaceae archaeon]
MHVPAFDSGAQDGYEVDDWEAHLMKFDEEGRELPDQTPIEVPLDFSRPLTLQEEIRRFLRIEASYVAENAGFETFEEADDFDVDDEEVEFVSPYEILEMSDEQSFGRESIEGPARVAGQEGAGSARSDGEGPPAGGSAAEGADSARGSRAGDRDPAGAASAPDVE